MNILFIINGNILLLIRDFIGPSNYVDYWASNGQQILNT